MNIYTNYLMFQKTREEKYFNKIEHGIDKLLEQKLWRMNDEKDDLKQIIKDRFYKVFIKGLFKKQSYISTLNEIKDNKPISNKKHNSLVEAFVRKKNIMNLNEYICNNDFEKEFQDFANEQLIVRYIYTISDNVIRDYYNNQRKNNEMINQLIINMQSKENSNNIFEILINLIEKKDADFLKLNLEDNRVLTQEEVGIKLGVTQQYVSKRSQEIKEKYINLYRSLIRN